MKIAERAGRLFFTVFGIMGLLLLLLPGIGISADVVLSGSMEPEIRTGGLVFTDTGRRNPVPGDIITYQIHNSRITHRVVRKEGTFLITKGDANDAEDLVPVSPEQVLGTVVFTVPFLGYLITFMKRKTICAILVLMIMQEFIFMVQNERTERRAQKQAREKM